MDVDVKAMLKSTETLMSEITNLASMAGIDAGSQALKDACGKMLGMQDAIKDLRLGCALTATIICAVDILVRPQIYGDTAGSMQGVMKLASSLGVAKASLPSKLKTMIDDLSTASNKHRDKKDDKDKKDKKDKKGKDDKAKKSDKKDKARSSKG
jgi:hypothetical protein